MQLVQPEGVRFQLIELFSAEAIKAVKQVHRLRLEMEMRSCRPAARVPTETNDLPAQIGPCWGSSTQMAVAGLDSVAIEMKGPTEGSAPAAAADTVVGRPDRTTHNTGDVQRRMIRLNPMRHHTGHRHQQRRDQNKQGSS